MRARLAELGWELPEAHQPGAPLVAVVVHAGVARTSGQLPRRGGELIWPGRLGEGVSPSQGAEAAGWCVLGALAALEAELGDLDRVARVLSVTCYVASAAGFTGQPAVADGASRVLDAVFGAAGQHTRSAVGVAALPRGAAVEVELTVSIVD
ncbi:MAG: RidA family protein [Mycobacteriales bacterium]